ncbi:hypothetical protein TNCV_2402431 [Trichonephila clavipes]|nr:hypothetical protein TNCV_2402431 [Trichonephila clavipes]
MIAEQHAFRRHYDIPSRQRRTKERGPGGLDSPKDLDFFPIDYNPKYIVQQQGISPKKGKDIRRPLELLKKWNEFMCRFRPISDNDPIILIPHPTPPGFPWVSYKQRSPNNLSPCSGA